MPMPTSLAVVKVGGSLYDLPDLGPRLHGWLARAEAERLLLVPGGGALADAIRTLDRQHQLGDEKAHWLALRALSLQAHFLAALLPGAAIVADPRAANAPHARRWTILDAHAFAQADETHAEHLPHTWEVTSDSLAARAAIVGGAKSLVLLKSAALPEGIDWQQAGRRGFVDPSFARLVANLSVTVVNFRAG